MIRIAVADENTWFVEGLKALIGAQPGMRVVHASTHARDLAELAISRQVDIIVVGFAEPSELLKSVGSIPDGPSVLVLVDTPNVSHSQRLMRFGAAGILARRCGTDDLELALRALATGQRFFPSDLIDELITPSTERAPHESLSEREYQVFLALARGGTPADLSKSLQISVKSVMTYRTRVMGKMDLKSNSDLTYYALKRGLIT